MPELVNDTTASEIKDAANMLASSSTKRIDGDCFKAYTIGDNVVRIDIQMKEK